MLQQVQPKNETKNRRPTHTNKKKDYVITYEWYISDKPGSMTFFYVSIVILIISTMVNCLILYLAFLDDNNYGVSLLFRVLFFIPFNGTLSLLLWMEDLGMTSINNLLEFFGFRIHTASNNIIF